MILHYLKKIIKIFIILMILFIVSFFILNSLFPLPKEKLERERSTMIYDKKGKLLRAYTTEDGMWRSFTNIDTVLPLMKQALITYEDKRFYSHPGVDPLSMLRAIWTNLTRMEIVSGFSTITMQLARMIEPKERTVISKLMEMFRAFQIELTYSKDEILEFYLNIAPYGGNIEGIASASYIYFDKPHTQISAGEIALLMGLPNSPSKYRPDLYPEKAKKQRNKILKILRDENIIDDKVYEEALFEKVPNKRYDMPYDAPHLSDYLKLKYGKSKSEIHTTIDKSMQKSCKKLLSSHIKSIREKGIHNGAIVVIDNKTREVKALIGSADYFNDTHQGQVNGAMARRSPGSALKPFVYTLALEEGIIGSETTLIDLPEDFSGFTPKNYDEKYRGVVSASEALSLSLNVPAVYLMRSLKQKNIYNKLKEGGISTLDHDETHYGLSLILGGVEVMLIELTNLYSTLANGGMYQDTVIENDERNSHPYRVFMKESSYIVSEMLAEDHYLSGKVNWKTTLGQHKIAWKTGTSYSHRDAWSIGYDPYYTVGVWAGNFDNKESQDIVGVKAASPLMFDVFKSITKETNPKWFSIPDGVGIRRVSTVSGKIPNSWDDSTKPEFYIKGITNEDKCNIRQKIFIDKKTGLRLYYHCLDGKEYESKIMTIWPGKVNTWMKLNGLPIESVPETHPDCELFIGEKGPKIDSPTEGSIYYIRNDLSDKEQRIILRAHPEAGNKKVFWFLNDSPIGVSNVGEDLYYTPETGTHQLTVMDEEGRTSKVTFKVINVNQSKNP